MGAKLFFYYSAMNAGKSTTLLQSSYNYNERGMETILFIPELIGRTCVSCRIGLQAPAQVFGPDFDFFAHVKSLPGTASGPPCSCIMVDEAQFLNKEQVLQLARIVDQLQIPVLCYGLRSDFLGEPFEGSKYLLCSADCLIEIKTICSCGRKATMNQRITEDGQPLAAGEQVQVGGNERYVGKCRRHFWEGIEEAEARLRAQSEPDEVEAAVDGPKTPEKAKTRSSSLSTPSKTSRARPTREVDGVEKVQHQE